MRSKISFGVTTILCFTLAAGAAGAQAMGEGRQGPVVFDDRVLDESLAAMNDFLQSRYRYDEMMASLHTPPPDKDFEVVARSLGQRPDTARVATSDFGTPIVGGAALDVHLAAFNAEREERREPLFVRVARMSGGTLPDFADVADIPPVPASNDGFAEGNVQDDPTLDRSMTDLFDHMQWQATRDAALRSGVSEINTGSFDRYGEALTLF